MTVRIQRLPKIWCCWDGCRVTGQWGVFDEDDEFLGDFCKRHAQAEKRRVEKSHR